MSNVKIVDNKTGKPKKVGKSPEKDEEFLQKTVGRMWTSGNSVINSILEAAQAIIAVRAGRDPKTPRVNTGGAKDDAKPVVPKEPKWNTTDFGKSLLILTHINTKVDKAGNDKELADSWKNVIGPVGAAIGRSKRLLLSEVEAKVILDKMKLDESILPKSMIDQIGELFTIPDQIKLSKDEKLARKVAQKLEKQKKKEARSKTPSG